MYAIIQLRGEVNVRKDLRQTIKRLGLYRKNHLVLQLESPNIKRMLKKIESFITFGEIDEKTLTRLLEKRARLAGNKKVDLDFLKKNKIDSFTVLAKKVFEEKKVLKELGIKKVFRLNAPRKGFERGGIKKLFSTGGAAGYRSSDINALIQRMM
ncbi:50S ribosomal protein L30 [Candidatus Micrarchaeota archaeon]|nr:50S ribosomal protein L30 [Candidatus Micrarchaeota archaeon]MBU1930751.1 50S ribosomal protein L30 [Candidatus Micrarchaeota archaeon]